MTAFKTALLIPFLFVAFLTPTAHAMDSVERLLRESSRMINERLPSKMDPATTLVRTEVRGTRTFVYLYEITPGYEPEGGRAEFRGFMGPHLIAVACRDMKRPLADGARVEYEYTLEGSKYASFSISNSDC